MTHAADQISRMAVAHVAAWTRNRAEDTALMFAPDASISVNGGEPHSGHAEIIANAQALMDQFTGLVVRCRETRVAGSRAVLVWTLEGLHTQSGNYVILPGWQEWELNGDLKVHRSRAFYDVADFERQIASV